MAVEPAAVPKGRIVRAILLAGLLIAGGVALVTVLNPTVLRLPLGWAIICTFASLAISSLILWAVRVIRRPKFTTLPGTFMHRLAIVFVVVQLGFGVAALILLAAWLATLLLWPPRAMALLDASVLTIIASVPSSLAFRCFLNLAAILQRPTGEIPVR